MAGKDRPVEPLPDEFPSEDEAAEFWDTHSITDYEEFLVPEEVEIEMNRRHFEIEVDEESFLALRAGADRQPKPTKRLASEILKKNLTPI